MAYLNLPISLEKRSDMANLVLTTACNRNCAYCFTSRTALSLPREIRLDAAQEVLDWVAASGHSEVRLLGGEPTLHIQFPAILREALERGLQVVVFSNGLMPDGALAAIMNAPADKCRVMLNLNIGGADSDHLRTQVSETAAALGQRAFIGVNIHQPVLPLMEAVRFTEAHGLRKVIRIGLAHPGMDRKNRWLHPRDYRRAGHEIELFLRDIQPEGYSLSLDCGFVPCMFSDDFLHLAGMNAADIGCRCGAIPDILPDLTAIHCFPLGELDQLPISGVDTITQMNGLLQERARVFRGIGIFRECISCPLRESGQCHGGCIAAARSRSSAGPAPMRTLAPDRREAPAETARTWSIPYIDQPVKFWAALAEEHGSALEEVYFPLSLDEIGSGMPVQPQRYLDDLLRSRVVPMAGLINPIVLPRPLDELSGRILNELRRLHEHYGVCAVTVADARLAERIKSDLPSISLTASCLLDIFAPSQAGLLRDVFDVLVPSTGMLRFPARLAALRANFGRKLRLIVNESCLIPCLDRKQHFFEMGAGHSSPQSLCEPRLARDPWLRLTGAWVLPQHIHLLDPVADQYKLAGRVTLSDPDHYRKVLRAYIQRLALWPHEIGGGPASVLSRQSFPLDYFQTTMACDNTCSDCRYCRRMKE
jgi:hypothetical protein